MLETAKMRLENQGFHLTQETVCHSKSAASLVCTAPALRGGDLMDSSINYTIIMDNAPAPSNGGDLRLSLVPDPNIVTNGSALVIKDFTPGVRSPIRIHVRTTYYKLPVPTIHKLLFICGTFRV